MDLDGRSTCWMYTLYSSSPSSSGGSNPHCGTERAPFQHMKLESIWMYSTATAHLSMQIQVNDVICSVRRTAVSLAYLAVNQLSIHANTFLFLFSLATHRYAETPWPEREYTLLQELENNTVPQRRSPKWSLSGNVCVSATRSRKGDGSFSFTACDQRRSIS